MLAYSSDPNNPAGPSIDVYDYRDKSGKLVGQLIGPLYPYSQCLDDKGNVYIVDASTANAKIYEYGHGATIPIATVADSYGFPVGCAVNPITGDLAVANIEGNGSGSPGGIDIFSHGIAGTQSYYTDSAYGTYYFWPPGYDPQGNLYVQGTTQNGTPTLLKFNGATFTRLHGLEVNYPGAVQWDGKYMSATDQAATFVGSDITQSGQDEFTVKGSTATLVRQTIFADRCSGNFASDVVQPALVHVDGKTNMVYAGNLDCASRNDFWNYAKGGEPKRTLPPGTVPGTSFGQVVSPPSSR